MKKTVFLLAIAMSFACFAHAQKNYTSGILTMLEYANTNFKDIIGTKISDEPALEATNFSSKEILGIGSEKIVKNNNSEVAFYMCSLPLLGADKLIKDVLGKQLRKSREIYRRGFNRW